MTAPGAGLPFVKPEYSQFRPLRATLLPICSGNSFCPCIQALS
jgi:hypothetical protein